MNNKFEVCKGPVCSGSNADELLNFLKNHPDEGMKFDVTECDCNGNCGNAPVVMINGDDLAEVTIDMLADAIEYL